MRNKSTIPEHGRGQFLDATVDVFAEEGFHKARLDDVAGQSGLSKGTLYWYFKSKDETITAILDRFFDWEMKDLNLLVEDDAAASERLLQINAIVGTDLNRFTRLFSIACEILRNGRPSEGCARLLEPLLRKVPAVIGQAFSARG